MSFLVIKACGYVVWAILVRVTLRDIFWSDRRRDTAFIGKQLATFRHDFEKLSTLLDSERTAEITLSENDPRHDMAEERYEADCGTLEELKQDLEYLERIRDLHGFVEGQLSDWHRRYKACEARFTRHIRQIKRPLRRWSGSMPSVRTRRVS